jgi:hypothetical protein
MKRTPEELELSLRTLRALLQTIPIPADGDEIAVQDELERQLRSVTSAPLEREVSLSGHDKIDFIIGGDIGIEVKLRAPLGQMTRQLHRYAAHDRIAAIVLLTTSARLQANLIPPTLNGKPIRVVYLAARSF